MSVGVGGVVLLALYVALIAAILIVYYKIMVWLSD